jgi:hypothetical protein
MMLLRYRRKFRIKVFLNFFSTVNLINHDFSIEYISEENQEIIIRVKECLLPYLIRAYLHRSR